MSNDRDLTAEQTRHVHTGDEATGEQGELWARAADLPATDYAIVTAMIRYGGSFVHHLGTAASCADETNLARLKAAFPDYWDEYRRFAAFDALIGRGPK